MDNALIVIAGGVTGAAIVKLLDNIIVHILSRRAKKADKETVSLEAIYDVVQDISVQTARQGNALRVSMYDRIRYLVHNAINDGTVPYGLRCDIDRLYRSYKNDLDANGDLASEMELFYNLPLKHEHD